jgi:hypothetical protein
MDPVDLAQLGSHPIELVLPTGDEHEVVTVLGEKSRELRAEPG